MMPTTLAEAQDAARAVAQLLPTWLQPVFDTPFIHSAHLYDEFVHRLTLHVFTTMGLDAAARQAGTAEEILTRAGLNRKSARVPVDWILRRLARRGVVQEAGPIADRRFQLHAVVPALDTQPIRDEACEQDASWLPSYVLAETVARDYPAFLRAERSGEDILFAPARLRLWADFFSNDNGLYAVNNIVGAGALESWIPRGPAAIMELGGGLGSGAAAVLERLRATGRWVELREYRFTELVPAFLRRGQHALASRFRNASFLTFASLDMNAAFAPQGVGPGSLSVVYAVNTLHVARDLDFTLREIFAALTPGGQLIISECVRTEPGQPIYVEFIFNLMETFRAGGFLTPEQWRSAMEAVGFTDVRMVPDIPGIRACCPDFHVAAVGATRPV